MSRFRVISDFSPLVLALGLSLRLATPAYAELDQGTETPRVRPAEDETGRVSLPSIGQPQSSLVESTNSTTEQAVRIESFVTAESRLSGFVTKLAFDLGLIRQKGEDAWAALTRAGITPVGGWSRSAELTPEVFYEVLAAARRAAAAGRLSVSADGAEAIVRAALAPSLANLEEVPTEQLAVVAPVDQAAVASGESVLLYEQAPTWYGGWQSGLLAAPGGIIFYRPWGFHRWHRHPRFVPRAPWGYPPRFAPSGFLVGRSHGFAGPRLGPPLRIGAVTPRFSAPSLSRMSRGPGSMHLGIGRRQGGFSRR